MKNKKARSKDTNQTIYDMLKEFEALLKEYYDYFALSFTEVLSSVSLVSWEFQFCRYLTIKTRITLIGMTYVKAGIIYSL